MVDGINYVRAQMSQWGTQNWSLPQFLWQEAPISNAPFFSTAGLPQQ